MNKAEETFSKETDLYLQLVEKEHPDTENAMKQHAIAFAEWKDKLSPSQKCTVHPPAGSGGLHGIYTMTNDALYELFNNEQK